MSPAPPGLAPPQPLPDRYSRSEAYYDLWIVATFGQAFGSPARMSPAHKAHLIAWLDTRETEEIRASRP